MPTLARADMQLSAPRLRAVPLPGRACLGRGARGGPRTAVEVRLKPCFGHAREFTATTP